MKKTLLAFALLFTVSGCTPKDNKKTFWIYTSMYKDVISDLQPRLEKAFPDVKFQFYQAGSEEVAAKVQAEMLAGKPKADMLISSDRFWYEELAAKNNLVPFKVANDAEILTDYKHPENFYATLCFPVMVIAYNSEAIPEKEAPKSFKELADPKWKDKVSMPSPLASGTSFTTVAFLTKKYNWDLFKSLRQNNFIAEGGNSGVIRRLQSKERPVGIVLLENVLRLTATDPRIKIVVPADGAIIQSNVLAIPKKDNDPALAKKIADWMFSKEGQESMVKGYMYASVKGYSAPQGAPEFTDLTKSSVSWSREFIADTMKSREQIKDQFSKIVF